MCARSQELAALRGFIAAFGLLAACSLEVPGTGARPTSIGGVVSEPGPVVIENGQPTNGRGKEPPEAQERDAQTDDPRGPTAREAGAEANDAADAGANTDTSDAGQAPGCVLEGSYALRVAFDVSWVGTQFVGIVPIIDAGQGELSFTVLMKVSESGQGFTTSIRTCASEVPEFVATISRERYQARFRDEVWDAPTMPVFAGTLDASCSGPGCKVTFSPLTALIGAALSPPSAPWPERANDGEWPDHDGDGEPGIAVEMQRGQGNNYAYPPLDLLSLRRVPSMGLGLRVIVALDGALSSCDGLEGATLESSVETRAASCEAQPGNQSCTAAELTFLNQNLPAWTVRGGSFEAQRIEPDADCKAVRRRFPAR